MPAVFVHGNLETESIWDPLIGQLDRADVVTLSPPGFGAPVPPGFGATMPEYRDWLIDRLVDIGEPVDLVGTDWGGGHVINVAMTRPDLLRSWASDAVGIYDSEYSWHDLAQLWQTPEVGEQAVDALMSGTRAERSARISGGGIPPDVALQIADAMGPVMGWSLLSLYRSATDLETLRSTLASAADRPGLAINPTEDDFLGSLRSRVRAARIAGARTVQLDGLHHWWMLQDPSTSAAELTDFWSTLDRPA
ncbi:alpha/beta hydrolase [Rhodococcus fascians]|nr:alpha/beta hydrolase [Rhodococcus fascians]